MKHTGTKTLETKRLVLRALQMEDAQAMYENWASDAEVTKYLTWLPHESIEATKEMLKEWIPLYQKDDYYDWAITLKDQGKEAIGTIGVVQMDDRVQMVHIGYCLSRKYWHQGIMSEALQGVMDYFFKVVNINRIESRHDPRNANSGAVMMNCGMKQEGTKRQGDRNNQGICDCAYYAILKEDYEKLQKSET